MICRLFQWQIIVNCVHKNSRNENSDPDRIMVRLFVGFENAVCWTSQFVQYVNSVWRNIIDITHLDQIFQYSLTDPTACFDKKGFPVLPDS